MYLFIEDDAVVAFELEMRLKIEFHECIIQIVLRNYRYEKEQNQPGDDLGYFMIRIHYFYHIQCLTSYSKLDKNGQSLVTQIKICIINVPIYEAKEQ